MRENTLELVALEEAEPTEVGFPPRSLCSGCCCRLG